MASFPYVEITDIFNTYNYTIIEDSNLTLADADLRYLRLSGGIISGLTTFMNSLNVIGTISINGSPIDLTLISGVVSGTPQNNKALSLDASGSINGDLSLSGKIDCSQLNTTITTSSISWKSIAGSSSIALNHTLNGTALLGSISNTSFGFFTDNRERVRILNNGNFGIGTSTAAYKLDVNGDANISGNLIINNGTNEIRGNATVLSLHNTTGSSNDRISYTMDHNTIWEISLGGSSHSSVPNGLYWYNSGYKMVLTQNGRLGVGGVTSPRCGLEVSGTTNHTTVSFGTNTYIYNVSNNSWTNLDRKSVV